MLCGILHREPHCRVSEHAGARVPGVHVRRGDVRQRLGVRVGCLRRHAPVVRALGSAERAVGKDDRCTGRYAEAEGGHGKAKGIIWHVGYVNRYFSFLLEIMDSKDGRKNNIL